MKKKIIKILNKRYYKPISCLTAYSASVAKILDGRVDMILIGDSLGSTLYNMKNTQGVTLEMMKLHGKIVRKNVSSSVTILDMPYKTYSNKSRALNNAKKLLEFTKVKMLKIEVNYKNLDILKYLSSKNINMIAHIGVTPQSFKDFRKIKIVGKTQKEKKDLITLALKAESAGAKCILLECVSTETAREITRKVKIPTIGIGSSKFCDGQVLVFDDFINTDNNNKMPKFVKNYLNFARIAKKAVKDFDKEVKVGKFPSNKYSYK